MENELQVVTFDYSSIDKDSAQFLRIKEDNIRSICAKTISDVGKELCEAQERLSQNRYGCFEEWYTAIGFKKQTVYNYINYYNLIVQQLDNRDFIELLPKQVAYEISRPNAPDDLKQKVLSGEITTTKQYKELKKEKEEAERRAREAEAKTTEANETVGELINEVQKLNKELSKTPVHEVVKEVIPEDVKSEMGMLIKTNSKLQDENKRLKFEVEVHRGSSDPANAKANYESKVSTFIGRINMFLREMAPLGYVGNEVFRTSQQAQREYLDAIKSLEKWCSDIRQKLDETGSNMIIDMEVE